jgi:hypothetical protein
MVILSSEFYYEINLFSQLAVRSFQSILFILSPSPLISLFSLLFSFLFFVVPFSQRY